MPPLDDLIAEGERLMVICNACRYCEGYCAVFPAMERRLTFNEADINYLANLCHNCAECYYACQYAPPHEFAVNVPKVFAADPGYARTKNMHGRVSCMWARGWPSSIGIVIIALMAGGSFSNGCELLWRDFA